jgi:acyl-coenzyme A thioesterase PaaI-like protein
MSVDTTAGLEQLKTLMNAGAESGTGIGHLLGRTVRSLEPGRVVFSLTTSPAFGNPFGTVHGQPAQ